LADRVGSELLEVRPRPRKITAQRILTCQPPAAWPDKNEQKASETRPKAPNNVCKPCFIHVASYKQTKYEYSLNNIWQCSCCFF
jgi:hypothetical protein